MKLLGKLKENCRQAKNTFIYRMEGDRMLTLEKIKEYLGEIADGTDFSFNMGKTGNGLLVSMQGDNPCGEDWCTEFDISYPKDKADLIKSVWEEVDNCYQCFDVEEETYLMLEAKRNGFSGVPGIVDLVHNEEYKENALKEFAEKLCKLM